MKIQKTKDIVGKTRKIQKRNAKPVPPDPKPPRRHPKSPRSPTKQRKLLSKERIVDSSAEDDDPDTPEDDEPQEINSTSKRRKVGDLEKLRTFHSRSPSNVDDSGEKEMKESNQLKIFSTKEDERLHRIVAQYKEVPQINI